MSLRNVVKLTQNISSLHCASEILFIKNILVNFIYLFTLFLKVVDLII